jgi:hypothetical protein
MKIDRKYIGSLLIVVMTSPLAVVLLVNWLGTFWGIVAFVAYVLGQSWLLRKVMDIVDRRYE